MQKSSYLAGHSNIIYASYFDEHGDKIYREQEIFYLNKIDKK